MKMKIRLSSLVVLGIVQHCVENYPTLVNGSLLGLDIEDEIEVTRSFPLPQKDEEDEGDFGGEVFQIDMMKQLRKSNVDVNTVGWYQSAYYSSYISEAVVETQYNYQKSIGTSCMIIFDYNQSLSGNLHLKAFRLSDKFLKLYKSGVSDSENVLKESIGRMDIFEELEITFSNTKLVDFALREMTTGPKPLGRPFARLNNSVTPNLEKQMESLNDALSDYIDSRKKIFGKEKNLAKQQMQLHSQLQKREKENEERKLRGLAPLSSEEILSALRHLSEPRKCSSAIVASQIDDIVENSGGFSAQAVAKLFLFEKK